MSKTRVPCALVTSMDRHTTEELLGRLGLRHYFACTVTADDDMETMAQRYLSAAIKLGRPPNQCVVFAACPTSVTAAHNCTMKAVALLGTHKAFHLKNADLTCANMRDLSVYNIRRLFANRGSEHMDLRHKFTGKKPPARRLTNATFDGDEER
jgi:beta-phosphoglucomutase-like phosphatase (HAD superfamily)